MPQSLSGRSFLKLLDFTPDEIRYLIKLGHEFKRMKMAGTPHRYLEGKNIVLLFEKTSTRTRCSFEVAGHDLGMGVTYLDPAGSQMGKKESIADTARVLGRMFDGIEYRGYGQEIVEELAEYAGVPVWNGLTDNAHPTQALADLLTMREHGGKPFEEMKICYAGNARNNVSNSLLIGCLKTGMDIRIASPAELAPAPEVIESARKAEQENGGKLTLTDDLKAAVRDCDFIYTDVWLSMGETASLWEERIRLLEPYRITREIMDASRNGRCRFMHCLPAFHNTETDVGAEIFKRFGLYEMEVSDEVFESEASVVFEQAENRLHTIKAVLVATLRNRRKDNR